MNPQIGKPRNHAPAETILRRCLAQSCPDRILKNVVADSRKGILSFLLLRQIVIVALLLKPSHPQRRFQGLSQKPRREIKVGILANSGQQQMQMIRHEAIRCAHTAMPCAGMNHHSPTIKIAANTTMRLRPITSANTPDGTSSVRIATAQATFRSEYCSSVSPRSRTRIPGAEEIGFPRD